MTLQSSGAISISDINEELGNTAGATLTLGDTLPRWLAGVSAGAISLSDFYDAASIRVVDTKLGSSASGTSITFTGVDFGEEFDGRILFACIGLAASDAESLNQSSVTIGGVSTVGDDSGAFRAGGPACGAGLWAASGVTGTSGNVVVNWGSGTGAAGALILLSASGGFSTTPHDEVNGANGQSDTSTGNRTLDIPSNGLLIVSIAHRFGNDTTLTGVTERQELAFNSGEATLCVGFDNRKDSETNDTVSASWSTGIAVWGMEARSYQQF